MSTANNYLGGRFVGDDLFFVDGDQSFAEPVGIPRISFPMEGDSKNAVAAQAHVLKNLDNADTDYSPRPTVVADYANKTCFLIEQEFKCAADWFESLPLNTFYDPSFAHDYAGSLDLGSAILIAEGPQQDMGGGFVKWTRTYCYMKFDAHGFYVRNDYESIPFTFPGISNAGGQAFTQPFSTEVNARVERDYFIFTGSNFPDEFMEFYPFQTANGKNYPIADNIVLDDGSSSPTTAEYIAWETAGDEIVARSSCLRRWRGNIFELTTYYVKAQ